MQYEQEFINLCIPLVLVNLPPVIKLILLPMLFLVNVVKKISVNTVIN